MTNMADTQGGAMTLEKGLAAFLDAMLGKNRSSATLRAYRTDVLVVCPITFRFSD